MTKQIILILFVGIVLVSSHQPYNKSPLQNGGNSPLVKIGLGEIEGSILTTRLEKQFYAFRGIRYAKAPINELRFQPPVPVEKWKGVYDATVDGPSCPQPGFEPKSEDCLFLNVYTTKLPKGNDHPKLPVIIYFHSGGFYSVTSHSDWTGPQYYMDQEIVLVTTNYRLGSLGFISTGDKEAPGNNGLKDQVVAMKWVKEHIAAFGGDSDSITISGYSAGGFSVSLHLVSPMTQGLFHKAIMMSGTVFGQQSAPTHQFHIAQKQAYLLGCPNDTSVNIINCLKTKTADELGDSFFGFAEFGTEPVLLWQPVIEPDFGQERFLTEHPIQLVSNGQFAKVPVMTGVTFDEFANRAYVLAHNASLIGQLDKDFEKWAPIIFAYERYTEKSKAISKALRTFYFGDRTLDVSVLPALAQLYADSLTGFGVNRAAKLLAEKNDKPVYYYRFSFRGRYSHFYLPESNGTVPYGVVHHDDLIYFFYISKIFPEFKNTDPEIPTLEKLTTMWANFARTGKPIPEATDKLDNTKWEPFTLECQKFLDIGNKLKIEEDFFDQRYAEWERLFPLSQYIS